MESNTKCLRKNWNCIAETAETQVFGAPHVVIARWIGLPTQPRLRDDFGAQDASLGDIDNQVKP